jgi:transporter family-2 protein
MIDARVTERRRLRIECPPPVGMDERAKQRYPAGMKWMFILFALLAGAGMPMQAGINLRLRHALGDPVMAALVSFAVGTACLLAYAVAARLSLPPAGTLAGTPWWAWIGGALGAFFVFATIVLAGQLGAATTMAWLLAGQFLAALILDHFGLISFAMREVTWPRVAGVALIIAGAVLVNRY